MGKSDGRAAVSNPVGIPVRMKEIPLSQGKVALIDDADFELVNQFKWYANRDRRGYYAKRNVPAPHGRQTVQKMHTFIMGQRGIDHRDGDGLNNQRGNLRPATSVQNGRGFRRKAAGSSSSYRGVTWYKPRRKWGAQIGISPGKLLYLGLFTDEVEAAKAYDAAAREHFGEFASPNFPTV